MISNGATLKDLMAGTGWQTHSMRGSVSGAIVKKYGFYGRANLPLV